MIEQSILQNLIYNTEYTTRVIPYLKDEYFTEGASRVVYNLINKYINKYSGLPTTESLKIDIGNSTLSESVFNDSLELVDGFAECNSELKYLLETTEVWCKERALHIALFKAVSIASGEVKDLDKNSIPDILKEALSVNFDSCIGHDYFGDIDAQYDYYHNDESKIPFDIAILNKITNNGVPKKTLNVLMAPINAGKTTFLIHMAAHYIEMGLNVVYFTLEVAETVIRERIDVRLLKVPFDELRTLSKEAYTKRVSGLQSITNGTLVIKEFPTGSASVNHFRHILQELQLKKKFKPDVIIVDYLSICASSRLQSSAKANSNLYFTNVAQELRCLGIEYDVPVWTAEQFNRGGQDSESKDYSMSDVGLAIGIPATADLMLAVIPMEDLTKNNQVMCKQLKNRYAGKQHTTSFLLGLNNDMQIYSDTGQDRVLDSTDKLGSVSKASRDKLSNGGYS